MTMSRGLWDLPPTAYSAVSTAPRATRARDSVCRVSFTVSPGRYALELSTFSSSWQRWQVGGQLGWGEFFQSYASSVHPKLNHPICSHPVFSLNPPSTRTHTISSDASYLPLTGSSLDVHSQGVGHRDAPMIVEGHEVEGGHQVMVHKHGDGGQVSLGLSMDRHDLAPGQDLGESRVLLTAHPQP